MFKCGASNKQVHDAAYHAVGILIDLATLAICVDDIIKAVKASRAAIEAAAKKAWKPEFGKKLEYIFGNAKGNKHNIDRSKAMERQLNSIGIYDNANGRKLVIDNLTEAFYNPSSIRLPVQDNGRIVRESLLAGPNGLVKVESVWEGVKLITVTLLGGK